MADQHRLIQNGIVQEIGHFLTLMMRQSIWLFVSETDDESMVAESDEEGSEIVFTDESDEEKIL